ncbi:MAG TPA: hypothetical protein VI231_01575 [Candidatus Binatia bacterium]
MLLRKSILSALCLTGVIGLGAASAGAQGIISKEALNDGGYCHMKFESIWESTLGQQLPVLNDSGSADIVDFYGPCDHDPLGKDEIRAQELDDRRRRIEDFSD